MRKIVLLGAGSFDPITFMHVRIFVLSKDHLYKHYQWQVVGGLVSPAHDGYCKKNLITGVHRARMVELCLAEYRIPWLKLSDWEILQPEWRKTLESLEYHQAVVRTSPARWFPDLTPEDQAQVMLLCGSDLLETFSDPQLWNEAQVEAILTQYGVVCVTREEGEEGKVANIIKTSSVLSRFKEHIVVIPEWFRTSMSSTSIREAVQQGLSIGVLVPMSVAEYITSNRLYLSDEQTHKSGPPLVFLYKASRQKDHGDEYQEILEKENWRVVHIPVTNYQMLGIPELQSAVHKPDQYSGLILNSPFTVEALSVVAKSDEERWKSSLLPAWNRYPVYAVGSVASAIAGLLGLKCEQYESEEDLAEAVLKNRNAHNAARLLFPCGDLRLEAIRNRLIESGVLVEFVECYEHTAHPELVTMMQSALEKEGYPDVNVFFSPAGAESVAEILRVDSDAFSGTKNVAVGQITAAALQQLGFSVDGGSGSSSPRAVAVAVNDVTKL